MVGCARLVSRRTLALALLLAACRTRLLDGAGGARDAVVDEDASAALDGGSECPPFVLRALPLANLSPEDLNMCPLDLLRVSFTVETGPCQALGPVEITWDDASRTYTVTVLAYPPRPCAEPGRTLERSAILSDIARPPAGTVTVRDGAPGGSAGLTLPIQQVLSDGKCGTVGSPAPCRADADCEAGDPATRCSYDLGRCVRPCGSDEECPDATPRCSFGVCATGPCDASACAWGEACRTLPGGGACRSTSATLAGHACANDSDCGKGGLCACGACVAPCTTDATCPTGRCDGAFGCRP